MQDLWDYDAPLYSTDELHPNAWGADLMAERLYDWVVAHWTRDHARTTGTALPRERSAREVQIQKVRNQLACCAAGSFPRPRNDDGRPVRTAHRTQRHRPESNRCRRLCRPLRSHSATVPGPLHPTHLAGGASASRRGASLANLRARAAPNRG